MTELSALDLESGGFPQAYLGWRQASVVSVAGTSLLVRFTDNDSCLPLQLNFADSTLRIGQVIKIGSAFNAETILVQRGERLVFGRRLPH